MNIMHFFQIVYCCDAFKFILQWLCVVFLYNTINAHINPLPEAFGNVTSILAGNFGEVFSVART